MAELKPCPFCGGKAEMKYHRIYTTDAICIHCTECNTRTRSIAYDTMYQYYNGKKNVFISKAKAISDATVSWNKRVKE